MAGMIEKITGAIQGTKKVDARAIFAEVSQRPKATHAVAINNLMATIALVAEKGDNNPESRSKAIEAIGVIKNSDTDDVINMVSENVRELLDTEQAELDNAVLAEAEADNM